MAHKVYNKPVLDKLGVSKESVVSVLGVDDSEFWKVLKERNPGASQGRLRKATDLIFFGVNTKDGLRTLKRLKEYLKPNGAIWVVSKKGKEATLKEIDVISAAKSAGLVDNKVVSFSETHTSLRLVIPKDKR